jgi:hypothetical protein
MADNNGYFAGLRGTGSYGTDERPKNFREMILWMSPNGNAPLFALTSKAKTEKVDDPEFNWWEEVQNICRVRINNGGGYNNAAVTLTIDSGGRELIPGDILLYEKPTETEAYDNELLRVTSVTSDTVIVVTRGVAGTTADVLADDAYLLRVGNAQSEGNLSISTSSTNPVKYNNFCQIFKTPYTITKSDLETKKRTGDPRKNEQKRKTFQHAEKIEQALFWGKKYETTDPTNNNLPLRYTMGLRSFIQSHVKVFSADPTEDDFLNAVYPVFDYEAGEAGNERLVFCGNGALNWLNLLRKNNANTYIQYNGDIKFFGMDLQKWTIPQGTLYLKSHPLLNVHPVFQNSMFVINAAGIKYRPLGGRDTKLEKDIQPNDADYIKDQWLTECGFEFHFERTFAYIGGFKNF